MEAKEQFYTLALEEGLSLWQQAEHAKSQLFKRSKVTKVTMHSCPRASIQIEDLTMPSESTR